MPSHSVSSWFARRAVYPLWLRRNHPTYSRYARQFQKTQYLSADDLERWQAQRLRAQLLHAFRNVPFYRRRFETSGITPLDIRTPGDLKALPVLTKAELDCHNTELLARNIPTQARVSLQSGCFSDTQTDFWLDSERLDSRRAGFDRHNAWAGLRPGTPYAQISASRMDVRETPQGSSWTEAMIDRQLNLDISLISERDLVEYVARLRRFRPRIMVAYAQSAALFARYCEECGIRDIHFRAIIVTSEMLLPGQRSLIEEVFHAQVFNRYSSHKFSIIASDCPQLQGMHVNADALIVEIESSALYPTGIGRVLVTDLLNRAMPLIRYEIGDLASPLQNAACPCGRSFPRITNLRGRVTDFLVNTDNHCISGIPLAGITREVPQVRQLQFVQKDRGHIQLRVVPGSGYGVDTIVELQRRLNSYLRGAELGIVTVQSIQPERSGKWRFAKSRVEAIDALSGRRIA